MARPRAALLAWSAIALLQPHWWGAQAAAPAPQPAPGPAVGPAMHARAAGAAGALRLGRMTLLPCEIGSRAALGLPTVGAYCGAYEVPENWDAPRGRRIALNVAVVKSEASAPDPDLVVFLDGGPGGAATEDYPAVAGAFAPLLARRDILVMDQRGTGAANPLSCAQLARGPGSEIATDEAASVQSLRNCLAQIEPHAAPEYYTTSDAVRDLEEVRRALGGPRLDLIGISYGTRVAQQYAGRYADAVRSVVLDSPVPNRLVLLSEQARNLEHALRALFARCGMQAGCAQRVGDPYATLYHLRDALRAHPQAVEMHDPTTFESLHRTLTAADLVAVVRFYAYSPLTAALLPLMLHTADRGDYAPLLGQTKLINDDLGDRISSGLQLSVLCAEDADLLAPRPEDQGTLLGNEAISRLQAACAIWPRGRRPANFHAPLVTSLPVLVLSGQFDPVTPPEYGAEIVRGLRNARLLLANGQGHGVIGAGCMPRLVQRFLDVPQPGRLDAGCLRRLGATPLFIDYNGAAP
ncbi:MAG TPA: alpha/beta hydrolase [Steroidobacteraceae bacterium]